MIVVVEGASAAGKTTWCHRHAGDHFLAEANAGGGPSPEREADPVAWTRYWQQANEQRWSRALEAEQETGLVLCDTDPFKAHYIWCLWQAGTAQRAEWELQRDLCRGAFESGRLGFADLTLFADLPEDELRRHKDADRSRQRRRFDVHVQLAEPLRRWYSAVARLDQNRVVWSLPEDGLSKTLMSIGARPKRSGLDVFDAFLAELARVTVER